MAIAAKYGVDQHTAGGFISRYGLTNPSLASASLKSPADKAMVVLDQGKWQVYDVFFSRWLQYRYSEAWRKQTENSGSINLSDLGVLFLARNLTLYHQ